MSKLIQDGPGINPDNLFISGNIPVLTKGVTLSAGTNAKRGAVIIVDTTTGKGEVADKTKTALQVLGILTDDVVAETDTIATVYITGHFNQDELGFVTGTTLKDYEVELKKLGIYTDSVKGGN